MKNTSEKISRKQVFDFLSATNLATLATVDAQGKPHAAAVQFVVHKDFCLYFTSRVEARKFQNLISLTTVSMAITDGETMTTVQLTGEAERIEDFKAEQELLFEIWSLRFNEATWPSPSAQIFEHGFTNEVAVIKVRPTELTYATFKPQKDRKYQPFFHKII